jgi:hypothetical protein
MPPLPSIDSLAAYGGEMRNYSDPVDPTTDEDASYRNKYAANVAMMTHTVTRAFRSFLGSTAGATAIADPSSGSIHDAVWGDSAAVKPSATSIPSGTYDIIWPATVNDELGTSHTLSLRRAWANVESSDGTKRDADAKVTGARTVRVYTYESVAGLLLPSQLAGQTITVYVT